jgi:fumarate reductase flavoprotein subunit
VDLGAALDDTGVGGGDRTYNLTWHDWLNLKNLILVSQAIAAAALERTDSRGAHFREENPASGSLMESRYTLVRLEGEAVAVGSAPVAFTRVSPGETLLREAAE